MRFVHASDVHLDSPLRGLSRYEGAPVEQMRGATRRALSNLVDLCLAERAELLLLAGDLFDGGWRDYATGLYFAAQMSRLREADVTVIFVRGNHDAESRITRSLTMPSNVLELSSRAPETRVLGRLGVAIHGQGFAERAVREDLAARYPARVTDLLNIGILHTSVSGREGHEPYAPTTVGTLAGKGYAYWALGHVHAREVLSEDPWIVFSGNPQGRHARETGPKGATLVETDGERVLSVTARELDAVRWTRCDVDVEAAADVHDVVELARASLERASQDAGGRPLAARVTLRGATRAHDAMAADPERWTNEIRRLGSDVGDDVWIERVKLRTRGTGDHESLLARDDAVGQLARALESLAADPLAGTDLFSEVIAQWNKLPPELREGDDALRLSDPDVQREILRDVAETLLPRLLAGDDE